MEEEPANKRRRSDRDDGAPPKTPSNTDSAPPSLAAGVDALPDAVLQHCLSFIGKGHYRYVAGTSRRFNEIYSVNREKKTTIKSVVASVSCADLFLQDVTEQREHLTSGFLKIIFLSAAEFGNVKVLKWARSKGHEPEAGDFMFAGHVAVLQWAEENHLDWCSDELINIAIRNGQVCVLELAHSTGREIPTGVHSHTAATLGKYEVLSWLKEHDLLGSIQELWGAASIHDNVGVLDWLFDNGYRVPDFLLAYGLSLDQRNILVWARDHGLAWDVSTCRIAVLRENLSLLQWLRENDCPWDRTVVAAARYKGFDDIAQWAIDNGCPTEEEI